MGNIIPILELGAHDSALAMRFQGFLQELGRRLRAARESRGLSLAEVARESGISRRYLTDAEAGRANPSLQLLLTLSHTLGQSVSSLVDIPLRGRQGERIALVGLRGAGKSTVGRRLARLLEVPFVELDQRVEELAGVPLGTLFDLHGPDYFRRLEAEALEAVLAEGERSVIATGGSIVRSQTTYQRLLDTCRTIWLSAEPRDHLQRVIAQGDLRPMEGHPRAMDELEALLEARSPDYSRCELTVQTSGSDVDGVVRGVVRGLGLAVAGI